MLQTQNEIQLFIIGMIIIACMGTTTNPFISILFPCIYLTEFIIIVDKILWSYDHFVHEN